MINWLSHTYEGVKLRMTLLQPVSSLHGSFDSHGFGVEPLHAGWTVTVPVEVVELLQPDMLSVDYCIQCVT